MPDGPARPAGPTAPSPGMTARRLIADHYRRRRAAPPVEAGCRHAERSSRRAPGAGGATSRRWASGAREHRPALCGGPAQPPDRAGARHQRGQRAKINHRALARAERLQEEGTMSSRPTMTDAQRFDDALQAASRRYPAAEGSSSQRWLAQASPSGGNACRRANAPAERAGPHRRRAQRQPAWASLRCRRWRWAPWPCWPWRRPWPPPAAPRGPRCSASWAMCGIGFVT